LKYVVILYGDPDPNGKAIKYSIPGARCYA